ncbi:MAG: BREX-3 system P-loop-containing protein BrxF [Rhodospirillaceae bacterium]|nr:BREX-3 system P-loop-containing protein BrxF [Rhodospirillaceae bacterium]MYH37663.1 BREX-3 system P-loop-containing protein BrxF [Rhodospirillaceae bacterium]MYK12610.1 BREX-3 system P-loop-containing protein BrxF [Rhodospirillaceae bacterium]
MKGELVDPMTDRLQHAESLYHRLVLLVGAGGTGKSKTLHDVADRTGAPLVNVSLELSRRLLDVAERQRPHRVQRLLELIVAESDASVVLLDNIEILFHVALQQDPLRLLQTLSRSRTVAATWTGYIEDGYIEYARPGHPEHRRYPAEGILAVTLEGAD